MFQGADGKFMWPGFGENSRVLEWIFNRTSAQENIATKSAIGYIPTENALNLKGLQEEVDMGGLFDLPKDFWQEECSSIRKYFDEQVNVDLPEKITDELNDLEKRVNDM